MTWWQELPYHVSPVAFSIGSFQVRYYGLMYLVAFGITYLLVHYRLRKENYEYSTLTIEDLFIWLICGLLIGARLGDVFFYTFDYYLYHPLEIIVPFSFDNEIRFTGISGMSYHGGIVGIFVTAIIFCRRQKIAFWRMLDLIVPAGPLGYTFGRIGNFLNGELFGRVTDVSWGMYFPADYTHSLRHPSQLYEAFFEGIFLFVILWSIRTKRKFEGALFCLYIIGYGTVRFFIEFFREPETGFILWGFTMGQILCALMIISGLALYVVLASRDTPRSQE